MEMINEKEKQEVKEWLIKQTGESPLILYKFCEERKYANDIKKGRLYLNEIKHFRDLEISEKKKGRGDCDEGVWIEKGEKACLKNDEEVSMCCFFEYWREKLRSLMPHT